MTTQNTPKTDHVLQHGLSMTGKDELVYLSRQLERELAAIRAATIEECAKVCRSVGEDWKKDGDYSKQHAAEYLAELLTTGEKNG